MGFYITSTTRISIVPPNTTYITITLQNNNIRFPYLPKTDCRHQPTKAAANNDELCFCRLLHCYTHPSIRPGNNYSEIVKYYYLLSLQNLYESIKLNVFLLIENIFFKKQTYSTKFFLSHFQLKRFYKINYYNNSN